MRGFITGVLLTLASFSAGPISIFTLASSRSGPTIHPVQSSAGWRTWRWTSTSIETRPSRTTQCSRMHRTWRPAPASMSRTALTATAGCCSESAQCAPSSIRRFRKSSTTFLAIRMPICSGLSSMAYGSPVCRAGRESKTIRYGRSPPSSNIRRIFLLKHRRLGGKRLLRPQPTRLRSRQHRQRQVANPSRDSKPARSKCSSSLPSTRWQRYNSTFVLTL